MTFWKHVHGVRNAIQRNIWSVEANVSVKVITTTKILHVITVIKLCLRHIMYYI